MKLIKTALLTWLILLFSLKYFRITFLNNCVNEAFISIQWFFPVIPICAYAFLKMKDFKTSDKIAASTTIGITTFVFIAIFKFWDGMCDYTEPFYAYKHHKREKFIIAENFDCGATTGADEDDYYIYTKHGSFMETRKLVNIKKLNQRKWIPISEEALKHLD